MLGQSRFDRLRELVEGGRSFLVLSISLYDLAYCGLTHEDPQTCTLSRSGASHSRTRSIEYYHHCY